MKNLTLFFLGSVVAACASDPPPPAASSASVDAATNTPSTSTDPVQTDVMRAAEADRRAEESAAARSPANAAPANADTKPSQRPAPAAVADNATSTPAPASQPDNSRVNERDRSGDTLTAGDQGGSEADRKLTQLVRQAVMKDDSLSFTAKNVKIITVNGKVTLRGPVKSEHERAAIDAAAKKVAGVTQVENLLELKK